MLFMQCYINVDFATFLQRYKVNVGCNVGCYTVTETLHCNVEFNVAVTLNVAYATLQQCYEVNVAETLQSQR